MAPLQLLAALLSICAGPAAAGHRVHARVSAGRWMAAAGPAFADGPNLAGAPAQQADPLPCRRPGRWKRAPRCRWPTPRCAPAGWCPQIRSEIWPSCTQLVWAAWAALALPARPDAAGCLQFEGSPAAGTNVSDGQTEVVDALQPPFPSIGKIETITIGPTGAGTGLCSGTLISA